LVATLVFLLLFLVCWTFRGVSDVLRASDVGQFTEVLAVLGEAA
jgi:hypothetical protein